MEFHAMGSDASGSGTSVSLQCCTEEMCKLVKLEISSDEAKKFEKLGNDEKIAEAAFTSAYKKVGDKVLQYTTLESLLKDHPDLLK